MTIGVHIKSGNRMGVCCLCVRDGSPVGWDVFIKQTPFVQIIGGTDKFVDAGETLCFGVDQEPAGSGTGNYPLSTENFEFALRSESIQGSGPCMDRKRAVPFRALDHLQLPAHKNPAHACFFDCSEADAPNMRGDSGRFLQDAKQTCMGQVTVHCHVRIGDRRFVGKVGDNNHS